MHKIIAFHSQKRPKIFNVSSTFSEKADHLSVIKTIFENWQQRPGIFEIQKLSNEGLSSEVLIRVAEELGHIRPKMDLTIQEFHSTLPFLKQLWKTTLNQYKNHIVLMYSRDMDLMFDLFQLWNAQSGFPLKIFSFSGSNQFWRTTSVFSDISSDQFQIETDYLSQFMISKYFLDNNQKFLLFDTGFMGRQLVYTKDLVAKHLDLETDNMLFNDAFSMRLVGGGAESMKIFPLFDFNVVGNIPFEVTKNIFPRTHARSIYTNLMEKGDFEYMLAHSLQKGPRFSAELVELKQIKGRIHVVPTKQVSEFPINIDSINNNPNESIVNPLASILLQLEAVLAVQTEILSWEDSFRLALEKTN